MEVAAPFSIVIVLAKFRRCSDLIVARSFARCKYCYEWGVVISPNSLFPVSNPTEDWRLETYWRWLKRSFVRDWTVPCTEEGRTNSWRTLNFQSVSEPSLCVRLNPFPPFIRNNILYCVTRSLIFLFITELQYRLPIKWQYLNGKRWFTSVKKTITVEKLWIVSFVELALVQTS